QSDAVRATLVRGTVQKGRVIVGLRATRNEGKVIPCWTEGVQRMKPGGKARLTCPPGIAYGERGAGGVIPPNATLNFEVELVSVRR
ncbi:FKBP-type peptidyl-prolyl cis-trans isomerase, partial [Acidovorax soli]